MLESRSRVLGGFTVRVSPLAPFVPVFRPEPILLRTPGPTWRMVWPDDGLPPRPAIMLARPAFDPGAGLPVLERVGRVGLRLTALLAMPVAEPLVAARARPFMARVLGADTEAGFADPTLAAVSALTFASFCSMGDGATRGRRFW